MSPSVPNHGILDIQEAKEGASSSSKLAAAAARGDPEAADRQLRSVRGGHQVSAQELVALPPFWSC